MDLVTIRLEIGDFSAFAVPSRGIVYTCFSSPGSVLHRRVAVGSRSARKHRERVKAASAGLLGFGVHSGTVVADVPGEYLRWCLDQYAIGTWQWKRCQNELFRRERIHDRACYEFDAPARLAAKQFKVLTGPKAVKNRRPDSIVSVERVDIGDGADGQLSPWGIRYPMGWNEMTRGERRAWKKRASAEFLKRPIGASVTVQNYREKRKASKASTVEPAIQDSGDSRDE